MLASRANLRFTRRKEIPDTHETDKSNPKLPAWKAGKTVAKDRLFFVQINGSTSGSGGGVELLQFPADQVWYRHPSRYTDVAIFPCCPDKSICDYVPIPIGQFLDEKIARNRQIGIGDETITIGLFNRHKGSSLDFWGQYRSRHHRSYACLSHRNEIDRRIERLSGYCQRNFTIHSLRERRS